MNIIPVESLNLGESNSIVQLNKRRILQINSIGKKNIDSMFNELEELLDSNSALSLKYLLENKMFYEQIHDEIIYNIIDCCNLKYRNEYIKDLKESYRVRGEKGIAFSWGFIIRKYERLA